MSDRDEPVKYLPDLHETRWDENDVEWTRPDTWEDYSCTGCKLTMMGGDAGWFDVETGKPSFDFCPYCGHPVEYDEGDFEWTREVES